MTTKESKTNWMTVKEVVRELKISRGLVLKCVESGELRSIRLGGKRILIDIDSLDRLAN